MSKVILVLVLLLLTITNIVAAQDYSAALSKSILFFEGQRSGKLPRNQRLTWRKDSALHDGSDVQVDLVGGYYDAGDNVKFNFPMAYTTTLLAWSVIDYGNLMGEEKGHAIDAVMWGADYLLKATSVSDVVYAVVGDPESDHACWERPEDMDTSRAAYAVDAQSPGSDLAGETAAALAASAFALKDANPRYSRILLRRATKVFQFADKYRGRYSDAVKQACPFYCSSGYEDELVWAAAWLYKATKTQYYWDYVVKNIGSIGGSFDLFGWDRKNAGINVLVSQIAMTEKKGNREPFVTDADRFMCSILPKSPSKSQTIYYSPGGLLFAPGPSNMQHVTSFSFLALSYARYLTLYDNKRNIQCGNLHFRPNDLVHMARTQVQYILGNNPMKMSYMVGYANNFPRRIHHRAASLPSVYKHPHPFTCQEGSPYFKTQDSDQNILEGAVIGGPNVDDTFTDNRWNVSNAEPANNVNAPLVGVLAYFTHSRTQISWDDEPLS